MAKKIIIGECQDILKVMSFEELQFFNEIRQDDKKWKVLNQFVRNQKLIKMDQMYRLRRPRSVDEAVKNQMDHEYYAGRIADLVILLQLCENAGDELERRSRKEI